MYSDSYEGFISMRGGWGKNNKKVFKKISQRLYWNTTTTLPINIYQYWMVMIKHLA